jgi:hypothetical protein
VYDRDRLWYDLKNMIEEGDVPSNTQYNTSTIVRGGDHKHSWCEPRTFLVVPSCIS